MTLKRALLITVIAIAAVPAAAHAQAQINPPDGDNYLGPIFLNDETHAFPKTEIGFVADTTNYTTQADVFNPPSSGGPPESAICGQSNTIWSVFFIKHWGRMQISTAGVFDSVIGVATFNGPTDPAPRFRIACSDQLSGLEENTTFIVVPNQWYAVQVGGTGSPSGGKVQAKFHLLPPATIGGTDASLSLLGRKVTKLVIKAPKGAKVSLNCAHKGCGKLPRAFTVKKTTLTKPIGLVGPAATAPAGAVMRPSADIWSGQPVAAPRTRARAQAKFVQVRAAKSFTLLRGKTLPAGTTLEARVTEAGHIGTYFAWKIGPNGTQPKVTKCMEPASTKPRKTCS
jgi:hypothetical protein